MKQQHVLSSFCYFSIFFAGIIFPLVIRLVASNPYTKQHASRALLSHVVPYWFFFLSFAVLYAPPYELPSYGIHMAVFGVLAIITATLFIWNVVMGVRVLREGKVF